MVFKSKLSNRRIDTQKSDKHENEIKKYEFYDAQNEVFNNEF